MNPAVAGLAATWVALVGGAAWLWAHERAVERAERLTAGRSSAAPTAKDWPAFIDRAAVGLGRALLARDPRRRPVDDHRARRVGWLVLAAAVGVVVSPVVGVVAGAAAAATPPVVERRRQRVQREAVADDLPDVVDLLALAAGAGLTPALAVAAVGRRSDGPIGAELRRAHRQTEGGGRLADALDELPARLGDAVRPLVAVLVASERYGAALVPGLERLSTDVRLERQRRAEAAAGRIPVKLLFPLVGCILPAFALLTVAPLLAGAFRALRH